MGYKYTGDSTIGVSLTVDSPKPLDVRAVISTEKELFNVNPNTAYEGMSVACVDDGNIYILVDKLNIHNKNGWKASYESIQIQCVSYEEYLLILDNTTFVINEDGKKEYTYQRKEGLTAIDKYLLKDCYYYIYESGSDANPDFDGNSLLLPGYASEKYVTDLTTKVNDYLTEVSKYQTSVTNLNNTVISNKEELDVKTKEIEDNLIENYYQKSELYSKSEVYNTEEIDNTFVKISDVTGEGSDTDYIFVNKTLYNLDKELHNLDIEIINNTLDRTLKTNEDGSLTSLTVSEIKKSDESTAKLVLSDDIIKIGDFKVATSDDLFKKEIVTLEEYKNIPVKLDDTYYFITGTEPIDDNYVPEGGILANYLTVKTAENVYLTKTKASEFENQIENINTYISNHTAEFENQTSKLDNQISELEKSNVKIYNLTEQIVTLLGKASTLEEQVISLNLTITNLEEQIDNITSYNSNLELQLTDLKEQVEQIPLINVITQDGFDLLSEEEQERGVYIISDERIINLNNLVYDNKE